VEANAAVTAKSGSGAGGTGSSAGGAALSSSQRNNVLMVGSAVFVSLFTWGVVDGDSPPAQALAAVGLKGLIDDFAQPFAKPHTLKLLPDWPMPNVPPNMPCPHTLVLDLENTLVSSTWDRKFGWRHAKRPGVDKFLQELSQYYEIVLFSPSLPGVAEPVVNSLDKGGTIMHRLFRESTSFVDGVHVKDLSFLNRPLNRILVIDDDPDCVKLQPGNLIQVKPYTDPRDKADTTLLNLLPILIEIAKNNYDVTTVLEQFQGLDADGIAEEYQRRLDNVRNERIEQSQRGLGYFAGVGRDPYEQMGSGGGSVKLQDPTERSKESTSSKAGLTAMDLMGDVSLDGDTGQKKEGGVMGWYSRRLQAKAEDQERKMEKWQEVMQKKAEEKAKQEGN
jgi:import inner membrane translocase subunit TIM50